MKRKKIVRDLSLVVVVIFLSYTAAFPLKVQAKESTPAIAIQANKNRFGKQVDQLRLALEKAITELGQRENILKKQIDTLVGMDNSRVQAAITNLEKQISRLESLKVPENPTEVGELHTVQKQLMDSRLAGWKAVTAGTKEVWVLERNSRLYKRIGKQLTADINKTVQNLAQQEDQLKTRLAIETDKELVSNTQASINSLSEKINQLKAMEVPENPTNGDDLKKLQANYLGLRKTAMQEVKDGKKALAEAKKLQTR
ncbi:hypothetical protein M1116_01410 [Patescibacteria group bacterium]|nr:hypothetical protein [Patescibacteria group bacterium]